MKKLLVLALTAVLTMNIAGCGKATDEVAKKEVEVEAVEDEAGATGEEATGAEATGEEATGAEVTGEDSSGDMMDSYIKASEASFAAMAESVKDTMEFEVSGEGSTLKYQFRLLVDVGDKAATKAGLDAQIPAQEDSMKMALSAMAMTGIEDPVIVLEYFDKDGELIASYDFKK